MCTGCELSWMKNLKGKDAVLKWFSTSTAFTVPNCDCGIWHWIGQPDCSSISFSFSTESELHKDPASLINLLLLFNGKALIVGFSWGLLWSVWFFESVKRCNSSSNTQKPANGFDNLLLQWPASHSENKVNFCCCCCCCCY